MSGSIANASSLSPRRSFPQDPNPAHDMNFRFVFRQLGLLLLVLCFCIGLIVAWEATGWLIDPSKGPERLAMQAMLATIAIGSVAGLLLFVLGRHSAKVQLHRREALLLVALAWLLGAALAGLPFRLWAQLDPNVPEAHQFNQFSSCYFEAMSGLTTTGATVLGGEPGLRIVDLPQALLLWRSTTHWLGGLGIVVLFVAVLPFLGAEGKRLFRVEAAGSTKQGVRPRIGETARVLWFIYIGFTVASILLLRSSGVGWFESVCHSFSMVSTGGLSTRDSSIGAYNSVMVDVICMFFMLAAGVNFALYFRIVQGRLRSVWQDTELWVYLGLKVAVVLLVTVNLVAAGTAITTTTGASVDASVGQALRYGTFQTIALHTGTGFCTADYETWPILSRILLVGLMFIGGCVGSTAGGIKVIRLWIALKVIAGGLEKAFRPSVVRPLRVGGSIIDPDHRMDAVTYFLIILLLFGLGTSVLVLIEPVNGRCDFQTAMIATVSTLCNVGPGLNEVGPTKNYAWFTSSSKLVLSLLMCLGRLEVFAIFVLFLPGFWRQD